MIAAPRLPSWLASATGAFVPTLGLSAALALAGCPVETNVDGKDTGGDEGDSCGGPVSLIEPAEISITLGQVATLSGSAQPCGNTTTTPSWTLDSMPVDSELDTTMINTTDPWNPYITPDVVGTYVLALNVSDDAGAKSATVYGVITVTSGNSAPIADCGDNQSAEVGDRVDLDGSKSSDPDGAELSYEWALSSMPGCSGLEADDVFNGTTSTASVVPDCAGVFVMALVVSDGENWSDPDYCAITVEEDNQAPIADAGDSSVLSPCTEEQYHLDGYGSYDPEGEPLTSQWSLVSYPSEVIDASVLTFNDDTLPDPYFHWTVPGDYTFQLQVHDGVNWSAPDVVTYSFVDEGENSAPVANAGDDQTIENDPDCTTASYVFACEDCPADSVEIDGSASTDPVDGDELDFYWTEATGELTIEAPYSPTTGVITPSFAATYNTTTTKVWTVELAVSDCSESDTDSVTVTYNCTGEYSP